jgi:predicted component of type VI protein secretion system
MMRFRVILAVAAFALAGCNANQEVNPSSRTAPGVVSGPDYNPYDPISYAQNNTGNCAMTITPACPSRR